MLRDRALRSEPIGLFSFVYRALHCDLRHRALHARLGPGLLGVEQRAQLDARKRGGLVGFGEQ
jgi:hypothetical protein